jgi:hypothetical protein
MQEPEHVINGTTYRALSASFAALIPDQLATSAEWSVNAYTGDDWTEQKAGWIADAPPGRPRWQVGEGRFMAIFGGGTYGPPLAYISHVRSSKQGLRLIAEAHQASLARPPRSRPCGERSTMARIVDAFLNAGR